MAGETYVVREGGSPTLATVTATSFVGDVTGDTTGNVTGDVTGNVTGNVTGSIFSSPTTVTADGAVTIPSVNTVFVITKAGVAAMTLADPTTVTHDGLIIEFVATTANAHTLDNSAGSGFNAAGAAGDVGTFSGAIGDGVRLLAYGGVWHVLNNIGVTIA